MSEGSHVQPPLSLAMVVCDSLYRDPSTSKFTILGTFSEVNSIEFPFALPMLCVYCSISDGMGRFVLKFQIVNIEDEATPIAPAITRDVVWPHPLAIAEIPFTLRNVTFPKPGEYRAQLWADDNIIMERRIVANLLEQGVGQ
jgi:hypothetical protein